ncbi:MAG: methyltransferase domain-containing protein, partial [Ilumatobacteraceae bacterium]
MAVRQSAKRRGAYPTPAWLVSEVVGHALPPVTAGQRVTVLDPACGDGRFLVAAAGALRHRGAVPVLRGIDIDGDAIAQARHHLAPALDAAADVELVVGDALGEDDVLGAEPFDVVVGNP